MLDMPVPADLIHLEDVEVGRLVCFGEKQVTKDEIIAYARAYDPQPFHLDEEAAKQTLLGGLSASGFHSCAILMRMVADEVLNRATSLGSPGIDEVRWTRPVRPGDRLTARFTCSDKRVLRSRPEVGIAKIRFELVNGDGVSVMYWDTNQLLRVRHPGRAEAATGGGDTAARPAPLVSLWEGTPGPAPSRLANYFEDRVIGETYDLGAHTFTRDDILEFARAYDPQPFHLDDAAAAKSLFKRLSASGWHTASIWIRHFVHWRQASEAEMRAKGIRPAAYGPSPGFRDLRWLAPVHPGDTIAFRARTVGLLDWKGRPDRGLVQSDTQGRNQHGQVVFSMRGQLLVERRQPKT